jgi:hypothetical protein
MQIAAALWQPANLVKIFSDIVVKAGRQGR